MPLPSTHGVKAGVSACLAASCLVLASAWPGARGAEFNAAISPPRFELGAEPGGVKREVIRISNLADTPAEFLVRTADWDLSDGGGLKIHPEALQPDSCRPWTRIERHRVTVAPQQQRSYRFEIHVPEDAERGECRFAILFQQPPESADRMAMGGVSLPVMGQVAVIAYVTVGDAAPALSVKRLVRTPDNSKSPVALVMENSGDAHGRPQGIVKARTADGAGLEFVVAPVSVLPGTERRVPLWPAGSAEDLPVLTFPLRLDGRVEWQGGDYRLQTTVE